LSIKLDKCKIWCQNDFLVFACFGWDFKPDMSSGSSTVPTSVWACQEKIDSLKSTVQSVSTFWKCGDIDLFRSQTIPIFFAEACKPSLLLCLVFLRKKNVFKGCTWHLPNDWCFFSTCNFAELNFYLFDANYLLKGDRVLVLKFICECNLNFLYLVQPNSKGKKRS
jgi:hypothetical protein